MKTHLAAVTNLIKNLRLQGILQLPPPLTHDKVEEEARKCKVSAGIVWLAMRVAGTRRSVVLSFLLLCQAVIRVSNRMRFLFVFHFSPPVFFCDVRRSI